MMTGGGRVVTWNQFSTLIMRYGRIVKMMKAVTARASRHGAPAPARAGAAAEARPSADGINGPALRPASLHSV